MSRAAAIDFVRGGAGRLWTGHDGPASAAIRLAGACPLPAFRPLDGAWAELCRAAADPASRLEHRLPALIAAGARPYGLVSDSHGRLLCRRGRRRGRWLLPIWSLETGASARGLGGDGRSGAGPRVRAALARLLAIEDLPILVKFGQVDVEFVHPFKRLAAGARAFDETEFDAFLDETVGRYAAFLADVVPAGRRARVRVTSPFPPVLSDAAWRAGYVNAHIVDQHGPAGQDLAEALAGMEIPDLWRRTALHRRAGERLREAVEAEGFVFVDDLSPFLGADGRVDPALTGPGAGHDHHLDFRASRRVMLDRIWSIID
ncbi:hypothetical protein AS593_14345 [Caulobacter vibrioides]|nr:hypothetical protein AS593_14345 [Caulobacter vibrioides]